MSNKFTQCPPLRFAENLKTLRKLQGWNQITLAKKLYVHQNQISHWETGKCEPSLTNIIRICNLFHVTVETLLFEWVYF